jgi:Flp pilus assembly protein TadG
MSRTVTRPPPQRGATAVEFALVLVLFFTFLLGIVDFARMLYTWNAATEATRAGARYAVVCDGIGNSAAVLARMQALLPEITQIDLAWTPPACTQATCTGVTVTVQNLNYRWISPILGAAAFTDWPMPTFPTFLTREVMRQDPNSEAICL